jgi:hypothetical protein
VQAALSTALEASFQCPGCRVAHHLTEHDLKPPWE